MRKLLELEDHFPKTGEPTVQLAAWRGPTGGLSIEKRAFAESHSPLYDFLKGVQPEEGITYLLVNAIGAWETYDENQNGDGFNVRPFMVGTRAKCGHPECTKALDGWVSEPEGLLHHYKSFEEHGGIYRHHCFPAGTPIRLGDGRRVPIESIEPGELVQTLEGKKRVTHALAREYHGPGVRLSLRGQLDTLTSTAEHPVLVYRRAQIHCRHNYSRTTPKTHAACCLEWREPIGAPEWVPASTVLPGDYLITPRTDGEREVDPAFAALVGWVASEGNYQPNGLIQFTFAEANRADIESVKACLRALGLHAGETPQPQYGLTHIWASSVDLVDRLRLYVTGTYSEKRLTAACLDWNEDGLLRLIGAYIDGDGHVCPRGKNRGQLRIRSSSPGMLHALVDICHALKTPVTLNWDGAAGEMVSPTNGKTYQHNGSGCVAVNAGFSELLTQHSRKKPTQGATRTPYSRQWDNTFLVEVTDIEELELNETVYNLEVEDVHHYVANEVIVHNCNKDPSKSLGTVPHALFNTRMQRTELLLKYVNKRDPEIPKRMGDGDFPAVSMGCMALGTRTSFADGRRRGIEGVCVGDTVLTHLGNVRRVTELHRRTYVGVVHHIKAEACREITCTHEHPFFCVKRTQVKSKNSKGTWCWREDVQQLTGQWKLAEELDPDEHFLLAPIERRVETPSYVSRAFARLLGYYVAEGCVIRDKADKICGFDLACNETDELLKEIPELCHTLGLPAPYVTVRSHSACARSVRVFHAQMAKLLATLGGTSACTKFLDASVLLWAPEFQRQMFGAYANGDGCATPHGALKVSTGSRDLAEQWLAILPRFGALPSFQVLEHEPNALVHIATTEYAVSVGGQWAQSLRDVCAKVQPYTIKARKEARKIIGNYIVTPIRRIRREAGSLPVYNFEVEGDESYVVEGLAVHNCHVRWDVCTICGHRAPTRAQYCEHARAHMREILADGRKVCVLNPSPRFFDISFVFRPADLTGWTMLKVAKREVRLSADLGARLDRSEHRAAEFDKAAQEMLDGWTRPYTLIGGYVQSLGPVAPEPLPQKTAAVLDRKRLLSQAEVVKLAAHEYGLELSADIQARLVIATPALASLLGRHTETFKGASLGPVGDVLRERAFAPWTDSEGPRVGPGAHYRAGEPPRSDLFTLTDPYSGHQYQTTRGAAMDSQTEDVKKQLLNTALFTGLYAAGLHGTLGSRGVPLAATLPVALGLGHLTERGVRRTFSPYRNPTYLTDQGVPVSGGTEFKEASVTPAAWAEKLAREADYRGLLADIGAQGGWRFVKWASLPLHLQVDTLTYGTNTPDAPDQLDLNRLAANVTALLTA